MRAIWICPKCGARLANRNLWPSCGQSTLETLFAGATPGVLELARTYVAMLHSFGDIQVIPTRPGWCASPGRFVGLSPAGSAQFPIHNLEVQNRCHWLQPSGFAATDKPLAAALGLSIAGPSTHVV